MSLSATGAHVDTCECTGRDMGAAMNNNAKLGFASTSHNFRYVVEIVI